MPRRDLILAALAVLICGSPIAGRAADSWPHWGGPNRNFTVDSTGLADSWPEAGPLELWRRDLGEGYSSILVDDACYS